MRKIILGSVFWSLAACVSQESSIGDDEYIIFFPTDAFADATGQQWNLPVHGWIHEPEKDSKARQLLLHALAERLGLEPGDAADILFQERAGMFLVDNERGEYIEVRAAGLSAQLGPSQANGHFSAILRLDKDAAAIPTGTTWLDVHADLPPGDARRFRGRSQLLEPEGVSVISDIDDTIKISQVLDKRLLLENTFLKPFSPIPGMAGLYRQWAEEGAAFHYVSASPWQLYPSLQAFIDDAGYPQGSFFLRLFRLNDGSFWDFMKSSEDYKLETIRRILQAYPKRRFILVGDAGERDPEIYGAIARDFPQQVLHVCIRDIGRVADEGPRMGQAFLGVAEERWRLFSDPLSLGDLTF